MKNLLEEADEGWIVPAERRVLTPDRYHAGYKPEKIEPIEGLIMHYTASRSPSSTIRWLTTKDKSYVSSTFVMERDGDLWQLAPLTDRCWHAGGKTSKFMGKQNVNGRTLGIELMNVGPLVRKAHGKWWTTGPFQKRWYGSMVSAAQEGSHFTAWEPFDVRQIESLINLLYFLTEEYPVLDASTILGHSDVDPTRKIDPGPVFPWEVIHEAILPF